MIGTRLGPWIIDRELGRGGMGVVYLAHRATPSERGPNQAAVKVLAAELAVEAGFLARFEREIDVLRQLDHPNIVRLYEPGKDNGRYFYAMEVVPGPSLDDLLKREGRLPWREVLELACQLAPALKHAHDRGVIHRDIKPANILIAGGDPHSPEKDAAGKKDSRETSAYIASSSGPSSTLGATPKIADFGIASLFASPHLTVTGGVIGTPEYLSPEQAAGKPATRRSDLYSFGVLLYALIVGRPPFEGEPLDLLHKHRYAQFERPLRFVPDLPHELDEVLCSLLEKSPDKRPSDGGALYRKLDSLRRKLERKGDTELPRTPDTRVDGAPLASSEEGPATLMSRLLRRELDQQNQGGRLRQFLNRPLVLIVLFVLAVSALAYAFWPLRPETMYRRGAALMSSSDPDDWDRAWDKYLEPLERKYPNRFPDEVAELRQRYEEKRAERLSEGTARRAGPMTEGQRFFQEGLRQRLRGDEEAAQRTWAGLIEAFKDVPAEKAWVERAAKERDSPRTSKAAADRQWRSLREAVRAARALQDDGKKEQAQAILRALRQLYRDDPEARKAIEAELAGGRKG